MLLRDFSIFQVKSIKIKSINFHFTIILVITVHPNLSRIRIHIQHLVRDPYPNLHLLNQKNMNVVLFMNAPFRSVCTVVRHISYHQLIITHCYQSHTRCEPSCMTWDNPTTKRAGSTPSQNNRMTESTYETCTWNGATKNLCTCNVSYEMRPRTRHVSNETRLRKFL